MPVKGAGSIEINANAELSNHVVSILSADIERKGWITYDQVKQ